MKIVESVSQWNLRALLVKSVSQLKHCKGKCKKCSKKKTPVKMSKMKYFFKRLIYYLRFLKLTLRKELFIVSDYDFEDICIFYEPNELIIYENDIEFSNSIYSYNFNKKEFEQIA